MVAETWKYTEWFKSSVRDKDFYLSYAEFIPELEEYENVAYWMSGGYGARLQNAGFALKLSAPGQAWLSSLDEELTKRKIATGLIDEMPNNTPIWAKPAEAKIEAIKAGLYTKQAVEKIAIEENIPINTKFQWTDSILEVNHEHRFYVVDEEILTGSPYLIDGEVYHNTMKSRYYEDAQNFAYYALNQLKENRPKTFTLDIGRNEVTSEWLVIEANPTWSSGIYGANPKLVLDALSLASNEDNEEWLWRPAEYLTNLAIKARKIKSISKSETNSGLIKIN